jgi:hypothetical protein
MEKKMLVHGVSSWQIMGESFGPVLCPNILVFWNVMLLHHWVDSSRCFTGG